MMRDVLIIGAGIAGLSVAMELRRRNFSFHLLEAGQLAGGRAQTQRLPSGAVADLGAHWLHGKDNPLRALVARYGIPAREDKAEALQIYEHGKVTYSKRMEWLDKAVNQAKAKRIETGKEADQPISALGRNEQGRNRLHQFATMWNGVDASLEPSAREFLTEKSEPGGLQPSGGISALVDAMVADIGPQHLTFSTPVTLLQSLADGVRIHTHDGGLWQARAAVFTGTLGVITSGKVMFDPPLSEPFRRQLAQISMGKMNKIILEIDPEFFMKHRIPVDLSLELLEGPVPHFCHVHSAGQPLISLFVSGPEAERIESFNPAESLAYATKILAPVKELRGFEKVVIGAPIVTQWVSNPYIQGAYSSCLPGGVRPKPQMQHNFYFCGDMFDGLYPASMAGAYRSGIACARLIARRHFLQRS